LKDCNIIYKELPQLVVALDSMNDDSNYIHIKDAKENMIYYCPCCKRIIKPRAYKEDKDYQVQPHFYHETSGCTEEAFVHFICKTWLFEHGCNFMISDKLYTVDKIETEKTYNTEFGGYRPDITVYTTCNKIFFFEIKNTSKKTEHYIPKWDELDNDVVEVDVRHFINQKIENDVPTFNLIYSNGECFIKSYTRTDYDELIAKRKLEWKRQDKLNYKMMWEKLDWFWIEVQNYKIDNSSSDKLLKAFKSLSFNDIEVCWNIIYKMSCCKNIKDKFREIVTSKSIEKSNLLLSDLKTKYKDILNFEFICQPKKDIYLKFYFTEDYSLFCVYSKSDYIYCENKSWTLLPSKIMMVFKAFREKENLINEHCINVVEIMKSITWNKAPMLYDNCIFKSYIRSRDILFTGNDMYIKDSSKVIDTIKDNIINEVSKTYKENYCMKQSEVEYFIDNCIKEYKIIYDILDIITTYNEYGYKYKGTTIMLFNITNDQIKFKETSLLYTLDKKNNVQKFIKDCVKEAIEEFEKCITAIDIISDIKRFSNNTWDFDIDIENKKIIIGLNYVIPYYDSYIKKICVNKDIDIAELFGENIYLEDYKKDVWNILNTRVAPVMNRLINEEINYYNSHNITSALYRIPEGYTYD
jgi:hypothetical protein